MYKLPCRLWPRLVLAVSAIGLLSLSSARTLAGEAEDTVVMVNPSSLKFQHDPEFPHCDFALLRGDPEKGPSVELNKSTGDCLVPMHWHSYGEAVTMVSGTGEIATSDGKHIWLKAGGYFFQPPHVAALGRFPKNSMFFTSFDGPIDTHFVDDTGQEISHDAAFARARTKPHKHR